MLPPLDLATLRQIAASVDVEAQRRFECVHGAQQRLVFILTLRNGLRHVRERDHEAAFFSGFQMCRIIQIDHNRYSFSPSCFLIPSCVPFLRSPELMGSTERLPFSVTFRWPPLPGSNVAPCEVNHFLNCLLFTEKTITLLLCRVNTSVALENVVKRITLLGF